MDGIEELKSLLCIGGSASEEEIIKSFDRIAELLINHAIIRRGERSFRIEEIEFYFYNNQHRDLITYPRITKPLQWYRNAFFGVDLTFDSKMGTTYEDGELLYTLDGSPCFGGILIRRLSCNGKITDKPRNCANALFDILDAAQISDNYPILEIEGYVRGMHIDTKPRTNILKECTEEMAKKKVETILWNNFYVNESAEDWMVNEFIKFVDRPYKYYSVQKIER